MSATLAKFHRMILNGVKLWSLCMLMSSSHVHNSLFWWCLCSVLRHQPGLHQSVVQRQWMQWIEGKNMIGWSGGQWKNLILGDFGVWFGMIQLWDFNGFWMNFTEFLNSSPVAASALAALNRAGAVAPAGQISLLPVYRQSTGLPIQRFKLVVTVSIPDGLTSCSEIYPKGTRKLPSAFRYA